MKLSTTLILLLLAIKTNAQLNDTTHVERFSFIIIDSLNKEPIANALISNPFERTTYLADKDGTLNLIVKNDFIQNTLYITKQNYFTKKICLKNLNNEKLILLSPKNNSTAKKIQPKLGSKSVTLNIFERNESNHYLGLSYQLQPFAFLQVAQKLNTIAEGMLNSITLSQLVFLNDKWVPEDTRYPDDSRSHSYLSMQQCSFKLRIYSADTHTGLPKEDLCNEIIEVKNFNNRNITVNLKQYKIMVPKGDFFVAVEWIRNDENMSKTTYNDESIAFNITSYRPFIGISTNEGPKLNVYGLTFFDKWEPLDNLSPDFTDLAISAEISY